MNNCQTKDRQCCCQCVSQTMLTYEWTKMPPVDYVCCIFYQMHGGPIIMMYNQHAGGCECFTQKEESDETSMEK